MSRLVENYSWKSIWNCYLGNNVLVHIDQWSILVYSMIGWRYQWFSIGCTGYIGWIGWIGWKLGLNFCINFASILYDDSHESFIDKNKYLSLINCSR